jgi:hypothetical protein
MPDERLAAPRDEMVLRECCGIDVAPPPRPPVLRPDDEPEGLRRCLELAVPLSVAAWLAFFAALACVWAS